MTSEEIKRAYSMREIVERYGIRIRQGGMCSCPFHGADKKPSMKIYKDNFHCFTCGADGDVFAFIQRIDNCDFKTAFLSLGGDYAAFSVQMKTEAGQKIESERILRQRKKKREEEAKRELSECIDIARNSTNEDEPLSERWCVAQEYLPLLTEWWEEKYINGEEVSTANVYRGCQRFRQRFNSV